MAEPAFLIGVLALGYLITSKILSPVRYARSPPPKTRNIYAHQADFSTSMGRLHEYANVVEEDTGFLGIKKQYYILPNGTKVIKYGDSKAEHFRQPVSPVSPSFTTQQSSDHTGKSIWSGTVS